MTLLGGIAAVVGVAAVTEDLARGQISNWTSGGALLAGLICHGGKAGWAGAGSSLLGAATGFALLLGFYLKGGMGGGDVKLMAGFGALLGAGAIFKAALLASLAGGVMALGYVAVHGARRYWQQRLAETSQASRVPEPRRETIPYAPAIAVGAWLALIERM